MDIAKIGARGKVVQCLSGVPALKVWPLLVPLLLVACTSRVVHAPPPTYLPPAPRPEISFEVISNSDFATTWSALIEYTASTSFSIDEFERESGLITLSFSPSDPASVVECGQWQESGKPPVPYVERTNMRLQTRTNLIVQQTGNLQTRVRANTLYILEDDNGTVYQFTTNQSATAQPRNRAAGTIRTRTCQANHEGERAFVAGVREALR